MSSTFGCPHCGRTNPLRATFCAGCGTYLKGLDAETLAQTAPPAPPDETETPPPTTPEPVFPDSARFQPWLQPDFDAPAPLNPETAASLQAQPWLRPEEESQDAHAPPNYAPQRLVVGLQGLLEPVEIAHDLLRPETPARTAMAELPYDLRRELRQTFAADLPLVDDPSTDAPGGEQPGKHGQGLWRRNGIYALLLAVILLALWVGNAPTGSRPHSWPGVGDAFSAISALPADSVVLVNWAYDPTTAGEMDMAALPVLEHLLEKNARLLVVSQLPGGPATARRLIGVARSRVSQAALARQMGEGLTEAGYLPGGVGSLPLLGQAPAQALPVDIQGRSLRDRSALKTLQDDSPALLLIVAARSDDIRQWMEQVQPLNDAPALVVSSAAADPVIRPYVDSGQIVGLVSGYAGGLAYGDLLVDAVPVAAQESQRRHITGQNWALVVLLLVILVGNLAGLLERGER